MSLHGLVAEAGASQIRYADPNFPDQPLTLFAARPKHFSKRTPVLLSHHGRSRNGADYRDYFLPHVDREDLLVIAPEFSLDAFPGQPWCNGGNLLDDEGRVNPPARRTYGIVDRLFQALRQGGITATERYGLFGHSGGSQYVHRTVSFGDRSRVAVAEAANAGTYTMPDLATPFPHGMGGTPMDEAGLRALLQFPLIVLAGTADNNPNELHVPSDAGSPAQGAHRYERAYRYMAEGRAAVERLNVPFAWTIVDGPDVGHDGRRMAEAALPLVVERLHGASVT